MGVDAARRYVISMLVIGARRGRGPRVAKGTAAMGVFQWDSSMFHGRYSQDTVERGTKGPANGLDAIVTGK
jgi:hypothetical protein